MIKRLLVGSAVLLFLSTSCQDKIDRQLEGKWQLKQIEANGVVTPVDTVYYNFQNKLFMYQIANGAPGTDRRGLGYKTIQDNNKLLLELRDIQLLPYIDWKEKKRLFVIDKHTGSSLVLKADGKTYRFKKF